MIQKAFKYAIFPNQEQQQSFAQHFGVSRFVYNVGIDIRDKYYQQHGKGISKRAVQDNFVFLKKTPEYSWMNDVNSQSILASLGNLHTAYQKFLSGCAGHPKYKSVKSGWQSFQCPQHVEVDFEKGTVKLPKIGEVKTNFHREFEGKVKTCTIKKTPADTYYVSVLVEIDEVLPEKTVVLEKETIGVDLGIKDFAITSDGGKVSNPRFLNGSLKLLKQLQKQLSRMRKGSSNYKKLKQKIARLHFKIANQRNDFLHKVSHNLLSEKQVATVAIEDLHVKGMIKNHKLARHIADVAWGRFVEFLKYKADWNGLNIIQCGRFQPSSKQCSCGYLNKDLKLSDRQWYCPECGIDHDRDILAAQNIKKFALEAIS